MKDKVVTSNPTVQAIISLRESELVLEVSDAAAAICRVLMCVNRVNLLSLFDKDPACHEIIVAYSGRCHCWIRTGDKKNVSA